ncbi:MAG: hypothetical protein RL618_2127 [Pseudomonadota bacterium]|jgi:hypothetical protein
MDAHVPQCAQMGGLKRRIESTVIKKTLPGERFLRR